VGYSATAHGGGQIAFNPAAHPGDADYGMLYAGFGDGGGPCAMSDTCIDQFHYGQDFSTIQAGIIRINPLQHGKDSYTVPADNPFTARQDHEKKIPGELFAKGFRNPSTMMFDQKTGRLFVGDISQNSIEEINLVEKGRNYGWGTRDGTWLYTDLTDTDNKLRYIPYGDGSDVMATEAGYDGKDRQGMPTAFQHINRKQDGFTYPVAQFSHHENGGIAAIVTGTVYHGTMAPALKGLFLFGNLSLDNIFYAHEEDLVNDQAPGKVFELNLLDSTGTPGSLSEIVMEEVGSEKKHLPAQAQAGKRINIRFGQDNAGDIYLVSKYNNVIYQLQSD
jgi:hypothetical protein